MSCSYEPQNDTELNATSLYKYKPNARMLEILMVFQCKAIDLSRYSAGAKSTLPKRAPKIRGKGSSQVATVKPEFVFQEDSVAVVKDLHQITLEIMVLGDASPSTWNVAGYSIEEKPTNTKEKQQSGSQSQAQIRVPRR